MESASRTAKAMGATPVGGDNLMGKIMEMAGGQGGQ